MTIDKKQLSYIPNISYEQDYYSEKENIHEDHSINVNDKNESDKLEDLQNIIQDIEFGTIGLNDDLKDLIAGVVDPVIDFIEDNKDFLDDKDSENDDDENKDDDEKDPTVIIEDEVIFIPIVNILDNEREDDKNESIKQIYKNNLIDLFNNFLKKIKNIIDNYWINIGLILIGKTDEYKKFILSDLDQSFTVDAKKQHMLDLAMKSQIHRLSKLSYASKLCPVDETLVHLRSLKMSTDLMLRYLDMEPEDSKTEYGDLSNTILESCIVNYNNRYNYTYKSAYKYLNSAVELIDEVLQLSIQEAKSKKYLK